MWWYREAERMELKSENNQTVCPNTQKPKNRKIHFLMEKVTGCATNIVNVPPVDVFAVH